MKNIKKFENFLTNHDHKQDDFIEDHKVVCPECSSDNVDMQLKGQCECITCGNTFTVNENLKADVAKLKDDAAKITKSMDTELLANDHAFDAYNDLTKAEHIIAKAEKSIKKIKSFETFSVSESSDDEEMKNKENKYLNRYADAASDIARKADGLAMEVGSDYESEQSKLEKIAEDLRSISGKFLDKIK